MESTMPQTILAPAIILVLWSLIMLLWMAAARFPAMAQLGSELQDLPAGGRGRDLEELLPPKVTWKAHNYDHLMEQPTIFYATVLVLAAIDQGVGANTMLAWAYCLTRIMHSLWQATINTVIPVRIGLFTLSTTCLLILAVRAGIAVFTVVY
jgi:hypothetical protein